MNIYWNIIIEFEILQMQYTHFRSAIETQIDAIWAAAGPKRRFEIRLLAHLMLLIFLDESHQL